VRSSLGAVDGFSVATARIDTAAVVARAVAEGLRAADLGGPVRTLAAAMPGGATAAAGEALATGWVAAVDIAADAIAGHSAALGGTAATYRAADASACRFAELRW
jgi:hypothetical protein